MQPRLRLVGSALVIALALSGMACSSSSGAKPPPSGDAGGGGGGTVATGGDLVPWDGVGDPYAGTSAELVEIGSEPVAFEASYALTGTVAAGVTGLTVELNGASPLAATIAGGRFTVALTLRPGPNFVSLAATDGAGAHAPLNQVIAYEDGVPTTSALIDAALASSAITAAEAIEYRVLAAFGDPRLPAQYRGRGAPDGMAALMDAVEAGSTLPAASQAVIAPFLVQDFYVQSGRSSPSAAAASMVASRPSIRGFNDLTCDGADCVVSPDWLSTTSAHVKVWWRNDHPSDEPSARAILDVVDGPHGAWAILEALMGHTPVPDDFLLLPGAAGGDSRLDIVLVNLAGDGITTPTRSGSTPVPVYIRVNRDLFPRQLVGATVHELMHAFVFARPLAAGTPDKYFGLGEGTANWATDRVLPTNNWEHQYNSGWLGQPELGIFHRADPYVGYGSWVFYRHLSAQLGRAVIPEIWDAAATLTEQATVLDTAIRAHTLGANDLETIWPKFAIAAGNATPDTALFALDQIRQEAKRVPDYWMNATGPLAIDTEVAPFGARYARFRFPSPVVRSFLILDGAGRELRFENVDPYALGWVPDVARPIAPVLYPLADAAKRGITLQARRRVGEIWQNVEDWTRSPSSSFEFGGFGEASGFFSDRGYAVLCRQALDADVRELDLVLSFGDTASPSRALAPAGAKMSAIASSTPCSLVRLVATGYAVPTAGVTFTHRWEGRYFQLRPFEVATATRDGTAVLGMRFGSEAGSESLRWNVSGTDANGCRADGSGNVPGVLTRNWLDVYTWALPPHEGAIDWEGHSAGDLSSQVWSRTCPPGDAGEPEVVVTSAVSFSNVWLDPYFSLDPATQALQRLTAAGTLSQSLAEYCPDNVCVYPDGGSLLVEPVQH